MRKVKGKRGVSLLLMRIFGHRRQSDSPNLSQLENGDFLCPPCYLPGLGPQHLRDLSPLPEIPPLTGSRPAAHKMPITWWLWGAAMRPPSAGRNHPTWHPAASGTLRSILLKAFQQPHPTDTFCLPRKGHWDSRWMAYSLYFIIRIRLKRHNLVLGGEMTIRWTFKERTI